MKKILIILLAVAIVIVIGICIWKNVHKDETLCAVTYRSQFGYSLTMTKSDELTTVTYMDDGKEPVVKDVDISCYNNVVEILDTYDFPAWRKFSEKEATTAGFNTLEIRYESGKTFFYSLSQNLPEKAKDVFPVINTCLLEYAGICK